MISIYFDIKELRFQVLAEKVRANDWEEKHEESLHAVKWKVVRKRESFYGGGSEEGFMAGGKGCFLSSNDSFTAVVAALKNGRFVVDVKLVSAFRGVVRALGTRTLKVF